MIDKWFNRKMERTTDYFQNLLLSGGGHQKVSGFEGCCWPEWVYVYVLVGPAHHNGAFVHRLVLSIPTYLYYFYLVIDSDMDR